MVVTTPWEAQADCSIELSSPLKVLYLGFSGVSWVLLTYLRALRNMVAFVP